jgi:hypothetical protein
VEVEVVTEKRPHPFIQYMGHARTSWGTRIYPDGRSEEWVAGPGWQPLVQLEVADVQALQAWVSDGGFFRLPPVIEPSHEADDGMTEEWTIELDGKHHTVTTRAQRVKPDPLLRSLYEEVQRLVGEALNRDADAAEANGPARLRRGRP